MEPENQSAAEIEELRGNPQRILEVVRNLISYADEEDEGAISSPEEFERVCSELKSRHDDFKSDNNLEPGQLIVWKQGLKNRTYPAYGQPAIVIEILDEPVYDDSQAGSSSYFREPLDLVAAIVFDDELPFFHFDSRRFKPLSE